MSGIILHSFSLVGHVIRKEIEIEDFKGAPKQTGGDGQNRDGCDRTGMGVRVQGWA